MPVRMMGGTLRATPEARGRSAGAPLAPHPEAAPVRAHGPGLAAALRAYRLEQIALVADDEARKAKRASMTTVERRNTRRRRDRAVEAVASTPEGRELLRLEADVIAGARAAAKAMAKAVPEYREVLGSALDLYVSTCVEYGLESPTARSFALQGAILSTAATALLGEAFEGGTRTMSGTRSAKDDKGVSGSIQVAGFRDLAQLAAAFVTKSQIAIETAWRCEDRARLESKERDRQRSAVTARIAAAQHRERETADAELVEDEEDQDVGGACNDRSPPASEKEHGPLGEVTPETASPSGDDLSDTRPAVVALEPGAFCRHRGKTVPASLAGKRPPSAATGADWPARLKAENERIAEWERETERAHMRASIERSKSR